MQNLEKIFFIRFTFDILEFIATTFFLALFKDVLFKKGELRQEIWSVVIQKKWVQDNIK